MKCFKLCSINFCLFIILTISSQAVADYAGEIIDIDCPQSVGVGEPIAFTVTVNNTGTSHWYETCLQLKYTLVDYSTGTSTCRFYDIFEAGSTETFSCTFDDGFEEEGIVVFTIKTGYFGSFVQCIVKDSEVCNVYIGDVTTTSITATTSVNSSSTTTTAESTTTTTTESTTTSSMGDGVVILNHTMTKQYVEPNVDCDNPPSEYTFTYNDEAAYLWVSWEGAVEQDTIKVTLHTPKGDQYFEIPGTFPYPSGCGGAIQLNISKYPENHISGEWRFDFYVNDLKSFSEYFNMVDPNTTTTTTSTLECTYGTCETTAECTEALGSGWVCNNGCCEQASFTTTTICPIESALAGDEAPLDVIRGFRDNVLSQTPEGQELIKLYYQWSPVIVQAMENDAAFKEEVKEMVDGVLELIE